MTDEKLRERVYILAERFSWLGMTSNIPTMTRDELEAAYRFLMRLAGE